MAVETDDGSLPANLKICLVLFCAGVRDWCQVNFQVFLVGLVASLACPKFFEVTLCDIVWSIIPMKRFLLFCVAFNCVAAANPRLPILAIQLDAPQMQLPQVGIPLHA